MPDRQSLNVEAFMDIQSLSYGGRIYGVSDASHILENAVQLEPKEEFKSNTPSTVRLQRDNAPQLSAEQYDADSQITRKAFFSIWDAQSGQADFYQKATNQLREVAPSLLSKDWDLGLDSGNQLVVHQGKDKLSKEEQQTLLKVFSSGQFKLDMKAIQDNLISWSQVNYQYSKSAGSVGHHQLNEDNITEIFRIRGMMEKVINNGPGREYNLEKDIQQQLLQRGNAYLKPESENLKLIDVLI